MATAVARSIFMFALVALVLSNGGALIAEAQGECSRNSPCPNLAHCCSNWGYCGVGNDYCGEGCQGGPCYGPTPPGPSPPSGSGLDAILTRSVFENFFPGHLSFYSYDVLIEAAKSFPQFGTTGDTDTRKREIAAYAAHVKHETGGLSVRLVSSKFHLRFKLVKCLILRPTLSNHSLMLHVNLFLF